MLNFVVALPCEARPIISHFGLQALDSPAGFRLYNRERMRLIVSGAGKIPAAAATAYAGATLGPGPAAWRRR